MKTLTEAEALAGGKEPSLIFGLQESVFAIEARAVREIHALPEVTGLVEARPGVAGIVNVRGQIVPVLDLQTVFGLRGARAPIDQTFIVLEAVREEGAFVFGIIVDEVRSVAALGLRDVSPLPALAPDRETTVAPTGLVSNVARLGQELVMVLQPELLAQAFAGSFPTEYSPVLPGEPSPEESIDGTLALTVKDTDRAILHHRALELMRTVEMPDYSHLLALALVELHGEFFGIELEIIREFCDIRNVTPVPCCPPHIVGQMNLRGEVLTLVDIRAVLGMPVSDTASLTRVVIVQDDDLRLGIPVSEVLDVLYLQPSQISTLPAAARSSSGTGLKATALHGKTMVGILDISRIIAEGGLLVEQDI